MSQFKVIASDEQFDEVFTTRARLERTVLTFKCLIDDRQAGKFYSCVESHLPPSMEKICLVLDQPMMARLAKELNEIVAGLPPYEAGSLLEESLRKCFNETTNAIANNYRLRMSATLLSGTAHTMVVMADYKPNRSSLGSLDRKRQEATMAYHAGYQAQVNPNYSLPPYVEPIFSPEVGG